MTARLTQGLKTLTLPMMWTSMNAHTTPQRVAVAFTAYADPDDHFLNYVTDLFDLERMAV